MHLWNFPFFNKNSVFLSAYHRAFVERCLQMLAVLLHHSCHCNPSFLCTLGRTSWTWLDVYITIPRQPHHQLHIPTIMQSKQYMPTEGSTQNLAAKDTYNLILQRTKWCSYCCCQMLTEKEGQTMQQLADWEAEIRRLQSKLLGTSPGTGYSWMNQPCVLAV
jgi:hypothetical protein